MKTTISVRCKYPQEHRLYHVIGKACPCKVSLWFKYGEPVNVTEVTDESLGVQIVSIVSETPPQVLFTDDEVEIVKECEE